MCLILSQEDPLEEGMANHSSSLAWRIPWTAWRPLRGLPAGTRASETGTRGWG